MFLYFAFLCLTVCAIPDCNWNRETNKLVDVPSGGCKNNGAHICGTGYLTMQLWETDTECNSPADATSCNPIGDSDCDTITKPMQPFNVGECFTRNAGGGITFSAKVFCADQSPGGADKSPRVDCNSDFAQNCIKCQEVSDECKALCKDDMDSDDCAVCKVCSKCEDFAECEDNTKEPECPGWKEDECWQCKECIECWDVHPAVAPEGCTQDGKCAADGACASCKTFVNDCLMDDFCEENKDHACMGCKECLGCFSDETKGTLGCFSCRECHMCTGFIQCMTGGLEACTPEKVGPLFMKNRVYINGFLTNMKDCLNTLMEEEQCDCLLSIPKEEIEKNDCYFETKSFGDMRATCECGEGGCDEGAGDRGVQVTSCEEYQCEEEPIYRKGAPTGQYIRCPPNNGKDWFSKDVGPLDDGSLIGFCQANGYHGLGINVFQANADPSSLTNTKDWMCNKNWTNKENIDYVTPGGNDSKGRLTFQCMTGTDEMMKCCQHDTWDDECVNFRTKFNNYMQCGLFDSCKPKCEEDPEVVECFKCCNDLMADQWNCPPRESSDTASPTSTNSPSRTPTESPVVTSTDSPSRTPTSAPSVGNLSAKSCADFGWSDEIHNLNDEFSAMDGGIGIEGVCGTKSGALCVGPKTWGQAELICTDMGARLCTEAEYAALEAAASGCNHEKNKRFIWTGTECKAYGGKPGHQSVRITNKGNNVASRCTPNQIKAYGGRCCADVHPEETSTDSPTSPISAETDAPSRSPTASPVTAETDAPSRTPTASPVTAETDAPSITPTASPITAETDAPSRTPTASPVTTETPSVSPSRTPTGSPVDSSTTSKPTEFDKVTAELICLSAETKKDCKKALPKTKGKCKFKSGKKGKSACKLKTFIAPVNCGTLTKRQCKTAIKKDNCVAADAKGHTCKDKAN